MFNWTIPGGCYWCSCSFHLLCEKTQDPSVYSAATCLPLDTLFRCPWPGRLDPGVRGLAAEAAGPWAMWLSGPGGVRGLPVEMRLGARSQPLFPTRWCVPCRRAGRSERCQQQQRLPAGEPGPPAPQSRGTQLSLPPSHTDPPAVHAPLPLSHSHHPAACGPHGRLLGSRRCLCL